jgi:Immunity protein 26
LQLNPSNKAPTTGDIFAILPTVGGFLFGRVIATNAMIGPMQNCILIYVYKSRSSTKDCIPNLVIDDLLLPPILTNQQSWKKGYFENVGRSALDNKLILPAHCFRASNGIFYDEFNTRLSNPTEHTGQWGLHSFRTIDDEISKALGIRLSEV